MKKFALLLILLSCSSLELVNFRNVKYFSMDAETLYNNKYSKNNISKDEFLRYYTQNDFATDANENVYLCDRDEFTISKYDKRGNKLFTINLENDYLNGIIFNSFSRNSDYKWLKIDIETDSENNVYCLITKEEYFFNFIKYDENGVLQSDFSLNSGYPSDRVTKFYITSVGKILFSTTQVDLTNPKYFGLGHTFVYNKDGTFLKRAKDYVQDSENNHYNSDYLEDGFEVAQSTQEQKLGIDKKKLKIPFKKIVKEIWQRSNSDSWFFVGIGNSQCIYYANNEQIAELNFSNRTIRYIKLSDILGSNYFFFYGVSSSRTNA